MASYLSSHALATSNLVGSAIDFLNKHDKLQQGIITGVYENEVVYVKLNDDQDANRIVSIPKASIQKVYQRLDTDRLAEGRMIHLNDYVLVTSKGLFHHFDGRAGYVENITIHNEFRLRGGSIGDVSNFALNAIFSLIGLVNLGVCTCTG